MKRLRVVGQKDVSQMLSVEQQKQLAGCTETSCLVEIAGAMGAQYLLDGTVGIVGQSNVLSLTLIDSSRGAVLGKKTAVVKGEREQLLASVHQLVAELMEPVIGGPVGEPRSDGRKAGASAPDSLATAKTIEPPFDYNLWGQVSFWSGVGLAGLGGVFTALASSSADDYAAGGKDPTASKDALDRNNALAVTCYVAGGLAMATGVTLWVLSPENPVRVQYRPHGDGGAVVLAGTW
jgi:hypothetical protein